MDANKQKARSKVTKADMRFKIGLGIGITIGAVTLLYVLLYGEDSIPEPLRTWIPMIMAIIFAGATLQFIFAADEVVQQY